MAAFMSICGRAPFFAEQYEWLTDLLGARKSEHGYARLHADKTVGRKMRTNIARWCFPQSTIQFLQEVERPRGYHKTKRVLTGSKEKKPAQA